MVGNLLRILDVVSLGRFEGKAFEQYATPFREGVINSSKYLSLRRILAISMTCFAAVFHYAFRALSLLQS